jgi:hypothetical protein
MAADLVGFHVTMGRQSILTREEYPRQEWDISVNPDGTVPRFIDDHVDPDACSMFYGYRVEAVFRGGRRSPPSLGLGYTTAPCFLPVDVTVWFEGLTLDVDARDQGDCCFPFCPAVDTDLEMRGYLEVISGSDNWRSTFDYDMQGGNTRGFNTTHVIHVTDPRQTITINVAVSERDSLCFWEGTPSIYGVIPPNAPACARFELPARATTEQWRRVHLHLVGGCDNAEDWTNHTVSVFVDGPP